MGKSLKYPQDMDVWYILPAIRRELALEFIDAGISQKSIAKILGITEAAISQYKKQKRAMVEFDAHVKNKIKEAASRAMKHPETIFREIMRVDQYIKTTGEFCRIHRSKSDTP